MGQESSEGLKWSLRALAGMSAVIGVGFIVWAIVIQNPPKSALPIGLIILGSLALFSALMGLFHSMCGRCCINMFLFFTGLLVIGEFAIVIALFADLDGNVQQIYDYDIEQEKADKKDGNRRMLLQTDDPTDGMSADELSLWEGIKSDLEIGRYVFLVFVLLEFIALMVTIVMRVRFPHKEGPEQFEEQQAARSAMAQIQMESLKQSVGRSNKYATSPAPNDGNFYTASGKMYKSVTRRMTQKYGEFTTDPAFQKKWWQNIPGFR